MQKQLFSKHFKAAQVVYMSLLGNFPITLCQLVSYYLVKVFIKLRQLCLVKFLSYREL